MWFSNCPFYAVSPQGCLLSCLFKGGNSISPHHAGFKSHWLYKLVKFGPSGFCSQCDENLSFLCGLHSVRVYFSPLSTPWAALSPEGSLVGPFSTPLHLHPSYFLSSASSLYLSVESFFCKSLGCLMGYLHWYECYLVVSMSQGELRVFWLHHLPGESLNILLHRHSDVLVNISLNKFLKVFFSKPWKLYFIWTQLWKKLFYISNNAVW